MEDLQTLEKESQPDVSDEEMIDNAKTHTQAQPNPNSDSSDSDDSDSDDEAQQSLQLQTLETELVNNPSNYDAHVQYVKLLRKMGDIEKLRQAREAMSAIFPLTPSMWQEWAKDEASLSSGPEAFLAIEKLYERGVFDYLSVPLWCDYLNFVREHDPSVCNFSPPGISKARNLFERALTATGLHVTEGNRIWEEYIEFEQAICGAIDKTTIEAKEKQVQRVRSIFHRHLSVPHSQLKSTLLGYKAWEVEQGNVLDVESSDVDGISSHVASAYQKALEMYNARVHFEEEICRQDITDSERLQQYMIYLKFEESFGNPARVQVLYERAIADFPISSDIWLEYTRYLDRTLKAVSNIAKDVYSRATKSCPWVGELWVRYLLSLERGHASEREMAAVFEKSLQCTFSTLDEYLELFLTRVDGLRRRILSTGELEDVLDFSLIRETFQYASDYLSSNMQNTDGLLRLHAYWARLELKLGKDLVAARGVWESLLKICGSMFDAWQGYIAMETELGHINEARFLYKRCYSKRFLGTGSEEICYSWLWFERELGMLEDFDRAVEKVTPRLEELRSFRLQQESNPTDQRETVSKPAREKRKAGSNITDEESPAKRQKSSSQNPKKVHGKDKARAVKLPEANKPEEIKSKVDKPESADENMKGTSIEKPKVYTDQCTAYISNLNLQANYDDLRGFFSDVGGIVAIRIPQDKFTKKSRGFAYVDFSDDAHLTAAVAKNKKMFLGKKISIARSQPKQRQKEFVGHDPSDQAGASGKSAETLPSTQKRGGDTVQFKGKNTFAMPRTVRPLGWKADKPQTKEEEDEKPKSNDEFRKMFIKD